MNDKNPLKKLSLSKVTIAHLNDEQMVAARGGSTGNTGGWSDACLTRKDTTC